MIINDFQYDGFWWLPENPDADVAGRLEFDANSGIVLKLMGSFYDTFEFNNDNTPEIILGVANRKHITLYKCREGRKELEIPGIIKYIYRAQFLFVGFLFNKASDIKFFKYSVSYQLLSEWLNITGFKYKIENDPKGIVKREILEYEFPNPPEYSLEKYTFSFNFHRNVSFDMLNSYRAEQIVSFCLESKDETSFEELQFWYFGHLQDFLTFAIGQATYPIMISAKSYANSYEHKDGEISYPDINIYLALNYPKEPGKKLHRSDFTFVYHNILGEFELIVNKWFKQKEVLEPVFNLYFSNLYNVKQYINTKFLNLVQAVESFHRRVYGGKYVDDREYESIAEVLSSYIPESLDEDFRESLKNKLTYLHEFSLQKRLKDIIKSCDPFSKLIIDNKKLFIDDVKNTRNYLTHYDEKLKEKAKKGRELYILNLKLRLLLEICILLHLGTGMNIETIIKNHNAYQQIKFMST